MTGVSDDEIKYTDYRMMLIHLKLCQHLPGEASLVRCTIRRGNGDVPIKVDDDPKENGQAVGELKIAGKTFRQRGKSGEQVETIKVR